MIRRANLWGVADAPGARGGGTPRGSSILSPDAALKLGELADAMLDCLKVLSAFLLVSFTGIGIAGAILVLLFIDL